MVETPYVAASGLRRIWPVVHHIAYRIWRALLAVRVAIVLAGLCLFVFDRAIAHAEAAGSKDRAYTLTLMCYAIAVDSGTSQDQTRTLDAARKMAKAQGYGDQRLSRDLLNMASVVGVRLRNDPASVDEDRTICQRLSLIG